MDENNEIYPLRALRMFTRGKLDKYELQEVDPLFYSIREDRTNLGQSKIVLDFDNGDSRSERKTVLNYMDLSDDDVWFANAIGNSYSNYEFMDSYQVQEDFNEGYIVYNEINEENLDKLKEIIKITTGNDLDIQDEKSRQLASKNLLKLFPDEIDYIVSDYGHEKNNEMTKTASEDIKKEINGVLEEFGFEVHSEWDQISTTPANLISLYYMYGVGHEGLGELIEKVFSDKLSRHSMGGWLDNSWEFQNSENFDGVSFNNTVERQLDKIMEKLEDESSDFSKRVEIIQELNKKFEFNKHYPLPKNPDYSFSIENVDTENNILIKLRKKENYQVKGRKLTLDNFYKLLYQPELFDIEF